MNGVGLIVRLKRFWAGERDVAGLYAGGFFQSFFFGIWVVALPFVIKRLSGLDSDVGLCVGLGFGGYVAACLLGRYVLDYLDAKRTVQCGAGAVAVVVTAMYLTVLAADKGYFGSKAILALTVLSGMQGFMTAMFWPPLMGWLSMGREGRQLNQRLGIHNVAWSFGALIGPLIGGYLIEVSSTLPVMVCVLITLLSFAAVSFARRPLGQGNIADRSGAKGDGDKIDLLGRRFMWMGRIALLGSFVCVGLLRTQLALLFKFNLGFSESDYGMVITVMCLVVFVVFFAMGRTHAWHYVLSIFLGVQVLMFLSMLMILNGAGLWEFFVSAGFAGVSQAFLYSSHLYYGVSGAKNRSGRMAVHEVILSAGIAVGSVAGGYLSDDFGRYAPYWFGIGVMAAGLLVQSGIYFLHKSGARGEAAGKRVKIED